MTQTLGTNANNDIYLGPTGNLVVDNGQKAVEDACQTAAQLQLGEAVLQTQLGMPNFQTIWVGVPNVAIWEAYLRRTFLSVNGVLAVTALVVTVADNVLAYTATIQSVYGEIFLNG